MLKQPETENPKREYTPTEVAAAKEYALGHKAKGKKSPAAEPKVSIQVGNGKKHELGPRGELPIEAKKEVEDVVRRGIAAGGAATKTGGIETTKLKSYIERIERLQSEKADLGADERDVFSEAKSNGFCTKTMRQIIKLRKMKSNERTEQEYLLDLYQRALGMQPSFNFDGEESK